jgi:deferrochelatase/peroxidase EfeB
MTRLRLQMRYRPMPPTNNRHPRIKVVEGALAFMSRITNDTWDNKLELQTAKPSWRSPLTAISNRHHRHPPT